MSWIAPVVAAVAALAALWPRSGSDLPASRWVDLGGAAGKAPLQRSGAHERDRVDAQIRSGDQLATCCELLSVAVASGCNTSSAIVEVGRTASAPSALVHAASDISRGRALAGVLERLATGAGGWHAMATLLATSADAGSDVSEPLRRLASAERLRMRREREATARRLPVLLLGPLAGLVLPAFALVTVVPFAIAGAQSFELPQVELSPVIEPEQPPMVPGGN